MTHAERNAAIKKLIEQRTEATTSTREIARETLIKEGIYTKKGNLTANYGGSYGKKTATA